MYNKKACRGFGKSIHNDDTEVDHKPNEIQFYPIEGLYSYWNYTVSIQARTSKGYGNWSASITTTTKESGRLLYLK